MMSDAESDEEVSVAHDDNREIGSDSVQHNDGGDDGWK